MGTSNSNISTLQKDKNVLLVGFEEFLNKEIVSNIFGNWKTPKPVTNIENFYFLKVDEKKFDFGLWCLKFNDLNFDSTLRILLNTVRINSIIMCFPRDNKENMKRLK